MLELLKSCKHPFYSCMQAGLIKYTTLNGLRQSIYAGSEKSALTKKFQCMGVRTILDHKTFELKLYKKSNLFHFYLKRPNNNTNVNISCTDRFSSDLCKLVIYCMAFASFYKTKETENSITILHTTFRYL